MRAYVQTEGKVQNGVVGAAVLGGGQTERISEEGCCGWDCQSGGPEEARGGVSTWWSCSECLKCILCVQLCSETISRPSLQIGLDEKWKNGQERNVLSPLINHGCVFFNHTEMTSLPYEIKQNRSQNEWKSTTPGLGEKSMVGTKKGHKLWCAVMRYVCY